MRFDKGKTPGRSKAGAREKAPQIRLVKSEERNPGAHTDAAASRQAARTGKKKKLSEFERYKRKLDRSRKTRAVFGVTLLTLCAVVFVAGFGLFSDSEFGTAFRTTFQKSTQYPVALSGELVRQMEPAGWNVVLMNNSDLLVYNNKGLKTLDVGHNYSTPVLKASGERILLYDQGGTRFVVASPTRELFTGVSVSAIHAGDVASNGNFAIATSSSKSASEVKVYNESGSEIFTWPSSNMVVSLALSPDGKQAAVCLLGAQDGHIVTTVALLDLQNPRLLFRTEFAEEFGYDVSFKQSSLCLITDRSVKTIDKSGKEKASFDFEGKQIVRFADGGQDNTVLVLGSSRYLRMNEIVTLDDRSRQIASLPVENELSMLRADSSGFYLMENSAIVRYNYKCERESRTMALGTLAYLPLGQDLYVASYEQLQKLQMR